MCQLLPPNPFFALNGSPSHYSALFSSFNLLPLKLYYILIFFTGILSSKTLYSHCLEEGLAQFV